MSLRVATKQPDGAIWPFMAGRGAIQKRVMDGLAEAGLIEKRGRLWFITEAGREALPRADPCPSRRRPSSSDLESGGVMSDKVRPLTSADRLFAYGRDADRAIGRKNDKPHHRTHRRVGVLDVIVIEEAGAPTRVFLSEGGPDGPIVETTVAALRQALAHVEEIVSQPPPARVRKRK
jgi:hypothetical protein